MSAQNDRRLRKHYLSATTVAGGNYGHNMETYGFNRERQLSQCACFMHCAKFMLTLFLFSGIRLHVLHPSVHTERPDLGLQGQHICACTRQRGTCLYLCNVMYVVMTRFANVKCKIECSDVGCRGKY